MLRRAATRSLRQVLAAHNTQNSVAGSIVQRWPIPTFSLAARHMSSLPPHTELGMPALSPTMSQGNIASWQVKEGDEVTAGDVLCDVETDKATMAWENQDDGFVAKILKPEGSRDIPVGTPVLILVDEETHVKAFADYQPGEQASSQQAAPEAAGPETSPPADEAKSAAPSHMQASSVMGPAARLLLAESGLSSSDVVPSGPGGIITKGDVLQAISSGKKSSQQPAPAAEPKPQQKEQEQPQQQRQKAAEKSAKQAESPARQVAEKEQPAASGPGRPSIRDANIKTILAAQMLERGEQIPAQWLKDWIRYREPASQQASQ